MALLLSIQLYLHGLSTWALIPPCWCLTPLELFDKEEEAARAYDKAVWRLKPNEARAYVNFKVSSKSLIFGLLLGDSHPMCPHAHTPHYHGSHQVLPLIHELHMSRLTSCPKLFLASRPPTSKLAAQKLKPEQDYMPEGAEPTEVVEESTEDFFSFAGIPKAMRTRSYVGKIQVCQELAAMYWSLI